MRCSRHRSLKSTQGVVVDGGIVDWNYCPMSVATHVVATCGCVDEVCGGVAEDDAAPGPA